jgi:hypothetical protein
VTAIGAIGRFVHGRRLQRHTQMADVIEGTTEAKRRRRAVPGAVSSSAGAGCFWGVVACAVACGVAYRQTHWRGWLVPAAFAVAIVVVVLLRALWGVAVLLGARATLTRRGVRCLVVHSNSPNWDTHIASHWLPRLGPIAATLNWSERASWDRSIEVRLFRHFVEARRNFNPAVLVLRGLRPPLVFRFFYAFREAKAGRPQYLQTLEEQLFRALDV